MARTYFEKGLEQDSNFAMLWLRLAAVDRESRWKYVERAKNLFPDISEGERMAILADEAAWVGNRRLHDSLIARIAQTHPGDYRYCQYMGNVYSSHHLHDSALFWYERAIENLPTFPRAHNDIGWALFFLGKDVEAERHFKKYVEFESDSSRSLFSLGDFYTAVGRYDEAVAQMEKGLASDPSDYDLRMGMVFAQSFNNDTTGARATIREWNKIAPDQLRQQRQATVMLSVVNDRLPDAVSILLGQTQEDNQKGKLFQTFSGLLASARLFILARQYEAASRTLSGAMEIMESASIEESQRTSLLKSYKTLSCLFNASAGDFQKATSDAADFLENADTVRQFREREKYHELRGTIALKQGQFVDALKHLGYSNTDSPIVTYGMGEAYLGQNDTLRARDMFARAIRTVTYDFTYLFVRSWSEDKLDSLN